MTRDLPGDQPSLRVLHLARWIRPTGGGIRAYLASTAAALHGSSIALRGGCVESGRATSYLPDVPHVGKPKSSTLLNAWRFWRWVRTAVTDVDVVHIHNFFGWPFFLGAAACCLKGAPFVVSPHGALEPLLFSRKTRKKRLFIDRVALPFLRRSAGLVATSPENAETLRKLEFGLPIHLVTPGVAVAAQPSVRFLQDPADAVHPELRVLYLGRFDAGKDVPTLIRAVGLLLSRGRKIRLDLVGWGTQVATQEARQTVAELKLQSAVHFRGYMDGDDKQNMLRDAHVMAIPSHSENFSFATAEALAVGLPAVVTTGVALRRVIEKGDCGSVVPPGDAEAMAAALAQYADPGFRKAKAVRAHSSAAQELSLTAMRRALEDLYRNAARGRQMPA